MKKIFTVLVLTGGLLLGAGLQADKVVLKDGQTLEGTFGKYDAYFLDVTAASGKVFTLPWREIAQIEASEFTGDMAMMSQYLSEDSVEVKSRVQARDPGRAFRQALFPGVLVHGLGHRAAGDEDGFLSLLGAELFGLMVGTFGASELMAPEKTGENKNTAAALAIAGGSIFALSWIWDMIGAPLSAKRFNQKNELTLAPLATPDGVLLGLNVKF